MLTERKISVAVNRPPENATLGQALKWFADRKGIKLAEVARRAGVSRTVISQIVAGQRGTGKVDLIEKALELAPGTLKRYDSEKLSPELREFLKKRPRLVSALAAFAAEDRSESDMLAMLGIAPADEIGFRDLDDEIEERLSAMGWVLDNYSIEVDSMRRPFAVVKAFPRATPEKSKTARIAAESSYPRVQVDELVRALIDGK